MKKIALIDFKIKIARLEQKGHFLEAFLIQSTYIESIFRRLFNYNLNLEGLKPALIKAIRDKNPYLNQIFKFCLKTEWFTKKQFDNASAYFEKRNTIVHDLIAINQTDLNKELIETLALGKQIIENHGNIERTIRVVQSIRTDENLVSMRESANLTSKETEIMQKRLAGMTLEEIGNEFGVTRERVRQIQTNAIKKMEGLMRRSISYSERLSKLGIDNSRSVDIFIKEICSKEQITMNDLIGKSRKAELVLVRQWVAFALKEKFKLSYPAIGKRLSRDHTTIIHAYQKIKYLTEEESRVAKK